MSYGRDYNMSCFYASKYTGAEVDAAIGAVLEGRAILLTNCPNCGAPISEGKCPYCGTDFLRTPAGESGPDRRPKRR